MTPHDRRENALRAPTIEDFRGEYRIRQGSIDETSSTGGGSDSADDPRRLVKVGRSIRLDPPGARTSAEDVLDFSLLEADGTVVMGPMPCQYHPGASVLYHRTDDYDGTGQPLTLQISLYADPESDYRSTYGVMIFGDPDNVGVWGADESG